MTELPVALDADRISREEVERLLKILLGLLVPREEAAFILRRSISHLDRLVAQGKMAKPIPLGNRCLMYMRSEVDAYAAQRQATAEVVAKAQRAAEAKARRQAAKAATKSARSRVSA